MLPINKNHTDDQFIQLIGQLSDAAIFIDQDFKVQHWNPAAESVFYCPSRDQYIEPGDHSFKILSSLCRDHHKELQEKGSWKGEVELRTPMDERCSLQVFIMTLTGDNDPFIRFLVVCKTMHGVKSSSGDRVKPTAEKKNAIEGLQNVKAEVKKKEVIKAIIDAQEKERTQVSYELHEQLSQNLATCKLLLDGLHLPESMEEEKIRLRSSMKLLMLTMNEIRNMSQQLNAAPLKMIGLVGVIGDMIAAINQNWQVKVQFQVNGLSRSTILPEDIELSAFRIFQEGMNNIIRHSGATHASVHLSKKNKSLLLSIKDDGKGFDATIIKESLGFTNITNRVQYHDGTISIDSSPGNGCLLEVKLPLNAKITDGR